MTSHEIFMLTALVATGIFLLQFVISVFFGDLDMDVDGDANADFDLGSLFSFKGLVHFLIGFGWTRVLFDGDTWQMYALAVLVGAVFMLGGCTIMMFGSILYAGFGMMARTGFSQRNMVIVSLSLSVGLGFTQATEMFKIFPEIVRTVFAENCVAVVFLLAVLLNLLLPKKEE